MFNKKSYWPLEILVFPVIDFLLGLELISSVLLIFYKDWGGLNQTQIQSLQSWFTFCIFVLEIPTGVFGDVNGKKKSVLLGYLFTIAGTILYTLVPSMTLFIIAEALFAVGVAFISGAEEALLYEVTKHLGFEAQYRKICVVSKVLHISGMIVASIMSIWMIDRIAPEVLFRLGAITSVLAFFMLALFVYEDEEQNNEKSLAPTYISTIKNALAIFKNAPNLKNITIYISIIGTTSYFVIWLYQEALRVLAVPSDMFGIYRIVLLVAEMLAMVVIAYLVEKTSVRWAMVIVASLTATGFLLAWYFHNILGVILVLSLSGGLGLQIPNVLSKDINGEITGKQRATVLSFMSMAKRLSLTIINPIIGVMVDNKGVFFAFALLGVLTLLAIFFKPKIIQE